MRNLIFLVVKKLGGRDIRVCWSEECSSTSIEANHPFLETYILFCVKINSIVGTWTSSNVH